MARGSSVEMHGGCTRSVHGPERLLSKKSSCNSVCFPYTISENGHEYDVCVKEVYCSAIRGLSKVQYTRRCTILAVALIAGLSNIAVYVLRTRFKMVSCSGALSRSSAGGRAK